MVDIKRLRAAVLKLVVETLCRVAKLTLPPKSKMFVLWHFSTNFLKYYDRELVTKKRQIKFENLFFSVKVSLAVRGGYNPKKFGNINQFKGFKPYLGQSSVFLSLFLFLHKSKPWKPIPQITRASWYEKNGSRNSEGDSNRGLVVS